MIPGLNRKNPQGRNHQIYQMSFQKNEQNERKSIQKYLADEQALFTSDLNRLGYSIIWTFSIHFEEYFFGLYF